MSNNTINNLVDKLSAKKDAWLLLLRLTVGPIFFQAGLGKFQNFERTAGFFSNIGIPFAELNVVLAAGTELIGGLLILLGLFTQLVSIPLAFVMLVALLTAHLAEVNSLMDLFAQTPFIYMVIFLVLSSTGAGKWSVDSKRDN